MELMERRPEPLPGRRRCQGRAWVNAFCEMPEGDQRLLAWKGEGSFTPCSRAVVTQDRVQEIAPNPSTDTPELSPVWLRDPRGTSTH